MNHHTVCGPLMVGVTAPPAEGVYIVTGQTGEKAEQIVHDGHEITAGKLAVMVGEPTDMPVVTPVWAPTVATLVLLLLQFEAEVKSSTLPLEYVA